MSPNGVEVILTTCPRDCYDSCGIAVVKRDGVVWKVVGDRSHPISRGSLCGKCALAYNGVWRDPDARLTQPLIKGSKQVHLQSTTEWYKTGGGYLRYLNMWGPGLSEYPEYTYTRTVPRYASGSVTATGVTLESAWNGATVPAGTAVANRLSHLAGCPFAGCMIWPYFFV